MIGSSQNWRHPRYTSHTFFHFLLLIYSRRRFWAAPGLSGRDLSSITSSTSFSTTSSTGDVTLISGTMRGRVVTDGEALLLVGVRLPGGVVTSGVRSPVGVTTSGVRLPSGVPSPAG